jgi:pyrimidine operon attenuation protein/uracil phosphoribosyltransferase
MPMVLPDPERLLSALAEQIKPHVTQQTALVGIYTGGVWIAQRLHEMLRLTQPVGTIDISFYRDDYRKSGLRAGVKPSDIRFAVEDADIVLVDDVLYTGRTIRAAMNELFDYGRPRSIQLAALLDRGGRQLPICPQYLGASVQVAPGEMIELERDDSGRFLLALTEREARE